MSSINQWKYDEDKMPRTIRFIHWHISSESVTLSIKRGNKIVNQTNLIHDNGSFSY